MAGRAGFRGVLIAAAFVLWSAVPAQAVTLRDLVDLSKSGVSDEILIALVEAERSVFHLNAADVQDLKRQGISDRLLLHLLQTPAIREEAARAEAPAHIMEPEPRRHAPAPQVVVIDRVETIAVPVYYPIYVPAPRPEKPAKPVYWGWGGKRRPDAWKEPDKQR